jgi:hypothetical protein
MASNLIMDRVRSVALAGGILAGGATMTGCDMVNQTQAAATPEDMQRCNQFAQGVADQTLENIKKADPGFLSRAGRAVTGSNSPREQHIDPESYPDKVKLSVYQQCLADARTANTETARRTTADAARAAVNTETSSRPVEPAAVVVPPAVRAPEAASAVPAAPIEPAASAPAAGPAASAPDTVVPSAPDLPGKVWERVVGPKRAPASPETGASGPSR